MSADRSPVTTDVDFEKDGKQVSYLRIPHSRDNSAWGALMLPITVVKNGRGPTVLFVGGSHGGEYEGPVCLMKLSRELQAEPLQGRVIIIPALNLPAVAAGRRLSPIDQRDMNRVFPGLWNGTITQVIAHYVHELILPLCDAVVDLHSGGYSLDLLPYISMHYLPDPQQMSRTLAAMTAFQAPISLIMEEFSGEGLLDYAVESMGKIFLCAELGGAGRLSRPALHVAESGTWNLLRHFQMIDGEVVTRAAQGLPDSRMMEVPDPENYHRVMVDGIYESYFELGEWVETGQTIGQVHFITQPAWSPQPVVARRTGMLIGTRGPGRVEIGDCVAVVARERET